MIFISALFCAFVFFILGISTAEKENFGPFHLKLVNWTDCSENGPNQIHVNFTVQDVNKTVDLLNGAIALPEGYTNEMMMTLDVAAWRNDSWVENIYFFKFKKACRSIQELIRSTFSDIAQHWNIEDNCPVPKGTYTFNNFPMKLNININEAAYGLYKGRYVVQQDGNPMGCFMIIFNAIRK